ncbi:MAG: hypothetical protein ABIB47_03455 [Candidatus Woesearchaeota archaeon]
MRISDELGSILRGFRGYLLKLDFGLVARLKQDAYSLAEADFDRKVLAMKSLMVQSHRDLVAQLDRTYKRLIADVWTHNIDDVDWKRLRLGEMVEQALSARAVEYKERWLEEAGRREVLEEEVVQLERDILNLTTSAIFRIADLSRAPYAQLAGGDILNATRHFWRVAGLKGGIDTLDGLVNTLGWEDKSEFMAAFSSDEPYKGRLLSGKQVRFSVSTIPFVDDNGVLIATGLSMIPEKKRFTRTYMQHAKQLEGVLKETWDTFKTTFVAFVPDRPKLEPETA